MLAVLTVVVFVVTGPLRREYASRARAGDESGAATTPDPAAGGETTPAELEAARDAKFREIRDAELDYRTGKLSPEDYQAIDSELRAEAIEILDRLELEER